ncbi:MAG: AMP-binding protein [Ruminococcus sp.]|nr:AMP-binding protein [Ruminococcus sp.]
MKQYQIYETLPNWRKISIGIWFDEICEKFQNRNAVTFQGSTLTYAELHHVVSNMANHFHKMGIQAGEKVVMQLPNRLSCIVCLFGLFKIGAIPVMALPAHRENELNGIMQTMQPCAYIVAEKYLGYNYTELARTLQQSYDSLRYVIIDGTAQEDFISLSTLMQTEQTEIATVSADAYDTAVMLLSGGTSGIPKAVPRTHADFLYNACRSAQKCRLTEQDIYLAVLPISHSFPLACPGVLGTMTVGGEVVLCEFASPDEILEHISENHVTLTALVPPLANLCLDMLEWDDSFNVSSLKKIQIGGAILEVTLAKRILQRFPNGLIQIFGMTEGLICMTDYDESEDILVTCQGKPISEADEICIVDEQQRPVPNGQNGELIAKGPCIIDHYYHAETVQFDEQGYFHTGDIACITSEGNLKIIGRMTEQINRAGEKIMPSEIENLLSDFEGIQQSAVIGVPDKLVGNKICVVAASKNKIDYAEICAFLAKKGLATFKMPDEIKTLPVLPLTAVGKVDKKKLSMWLKTGVI